jgi:hypothetical protein
LLSPLQRKYTVGLLTGSHSWVVNISIESSVTTLDEELPTKRKSSGDPQVRVIEEACYVLQPCLQKKDKILYTHTVKGCANLILIAEFTEFIFTMY